MRTDVSQFNGNLIGKKVQFLNTETHYGLLGSGVAENLKKEFDAALGEGPVFVKKDKCVKTTEYYNREEEPVTLENRLLTLENESGVEYKISAEWLEFKK